MNRYVLIKKEVPYNLFDNVKWHSYSRTTKADKEKMSVFGVKDTGKGIEYTMYLVVDLPLNKVRTKLIPLIVRKTQAIDKYITDAMGRMVGKYDRQAIVDSVRVGITNKEYMGSKK